MAFRNTQLYIEAKTVQTEHVFIAISGSYKLENGLFNEMVEKRYKNENKERTEKWDAMKWVKIRWN